MIQIQNLGTQTSNRWVRFGIEPERLPPFDCWRQSGDLFVAGPRIAGRSTVALDAKMQLLPGERRSYDLTSLIQQAAPQLIIPPQALQDPAGYFGVPHALSSDLIFKSCEPDGAALDVIFEARDQHDPQLHHRLRVRYRPDETRWRAWYRITASNVGMQQQVQVVLPQDLHLTMGRFDSGVLLAAGDYLGCGQSRVWHLWLGAGPMPETRLWGLGHERIGPMAALGPTTFQQGRFDVAVWIARQAPNVETQMTSWATANTIGVPPNSTQTGDEEEQGLYQGVEPFYQGGLAALEVNEKCVWSQIPRRPCHHLEPDGSRLKLELHPFFRSWQGIPHFDRNVSPDRLGMTTLITAGRAHGNYGPDDEHMILYRDSAIIELLDDPVAQEELENQAILWLACDTLDPHLSTSGVRAERAGGYAGLLVDQCRRLLKNRTLAGQVQDRWIARMGIYMRHDPDTDILLGLRPTFTLDNAGVRHPTSSSLGHIDINKWDRFAMTYQNAIGLYGKYCACRGIGYQEGVNWIVRHATTWMRASYGPSSNPARVWEEYEAVAVGPDGRFATSDDGRNQTGSYRLNWLPAGLIPVLHEGDVQARQQATQILTQLKLEARNRVETGRTYANQPADWLDPTVAT